MIVPSSSTSTLRRQLGSSSNGRPPPSRASARLPPAVTPIGLHSFRHHPSNALTRVATTALAAPASNQSAAERAGHALAGEPPPPRVPERNEDGTRAFREPTEDATPATVAGGPGGRWGGAGGPESGDCYLANYGTAVRVLREDLPQLLQRPLQWDIYRDDLEFHNPWGAPLRGLAPYQLMHTVMRWVARMLYRKSEVELLRLWSPVTGSGSGPRRDGLRTGSVSGSVPESEDDGRGGGIDGGGGGGGGSRRGGGLLRARWRATCWAWLPWEGVHRLEVVATYRFDQRGVIAVHELTHVVPPEPPLLLWPLLAVAQLMQRLRMGLQDGTGEGRRGMPIPGAGAKGVGVVGAEALERAVTSGWGGERLTDAGVGWVHMRRAR